MDRVKVAKQLIRLARAVMGGRVSVGDVCKVDLNVVKRRDSAPPYIKLVKKEIKNGGGLVDVKEIKNGQAGISGHDTHSWILGLVYVPLESLTAV